MTPVEERIDHVEARKRLTLWLEDAGMHSRYHRPYANPGELRADIQALLSEHTAREDVAALLDEACRSGFMPAEFVRRADRKLAALPATESAQPEPQWERPIDHAEVKRLAESHFAQPEEEPS